MILITMSLPNTYKAAFFTEKDKPLEIKEVELKKPGSGQVLVKVLACGVCHSDVGVSNGGLGDVFPRVPGHEIVGEVVAVGEGVTRFKEGDRVGGPWHGGKCFAPRQSGKFVPLTMRSG